MPALDLSPFRAITRLDVKVLSWFMDFHWEGAWAFFSTPDEADRDARYEEYVAGYGGNPRWVIRRWESIVNGTMIYYASLTALLMHSQVITDQAPNWEPPPYSDTFYERYFQSGSWSIQYPDPHADAFVTWQKPGVWAADEFEITNVERRKA